MAKLAKLVVQLEAQTAKYQRELDKTNRRLKRFERSQTSSLRVIKRGFLALATVVASVRFGSIIKQSLDLADQFNKLNDRLGISTEAISELSFVAEQSGVSFQQMSLGLQRMQRRVAEAAQGMGEAQGALKELGFDARKLAALPLEDQFEVVAQRLSEVEQQSDKVRLAFKLFDSEGVGLLQTMTRGAEGIRDLREEAQRLGRSLSEEQVEAATRAKESINSLQTAFSALTDEIAIRTAPALETFTTRLRVALFGTELEKARRELELLTDRMKFLAGAANIAGFLDASTERQLQGLAPKVRAVADRIVELEGRLKQTDAQAAETFENINESVSTLDGAMATVTVEIKQRGTPLSEEFLTTLSIDPSLIPEETRDVERLERTGTLMDVLKDKTEKLTDAQRDLGFTFQSAFEDAVIEGEKLSGVLKGLLQDILRIAIRSTITGPLGDALGGAFGGIFGGGKAAGGPVSAGTTYLVGEQGPEFFTPRTSGQVIPMGSGGPAINYNIDARGADEATVVSRMIPLLDQTVQFTIAEMQKMQDRGRFT